MTLTTENTPASTPAPTPCPTCLGVSPALGAAWQQVMAAAAALRQATTAVAEPLVGISVTGYGQGVIIQVEDRATAQFLAGQLTDLARTSSQSWTGTTHHRWAGRHTSGTTMTIVHLTNDTTAGDRS